MPSVAFAERVSLRTTSPLLRSTSVMLADMVIFFRSELDPCTDKVELDETDREVERSCVAAICWSESRLRSWRL